MIFNRYEFATLDVSSHNSPVLYLRKKDFSVSTLEESVWPMADCVHGFDGQKHSLCGYIPQYENCWSFVGDSFCSVKEVSVEDAARFDPGEIRTGKRFWTKKRYTYVEGWAKLREKKLVFITIYGGLTVVSDCPAWQQKGE